jgi:hypothetical protein
MTPDEKIREFLDDNSNPVDSFIPRYLTRDGLEDLRRRVRAHASREWLEQREGWLVPEVYTDELLALIERVICLEDALTRIARDTHTTECIEMGPMTQDDSCECHQEMASEALQLV